MTFRQRRLAKTTPCEQRAFDAASTILEASGCRYQSQQIDGLAVILTAFAEEEIRRSRLDEAREQPEHPRSS